MVNLVGKVPPLEASGAAVTLVHPTATTVAGQWDVTYPQDMPEEDRPNLGPTRTFGYAHRLVKNPPRFARRHVRRDIQIDARDKNGWSNAESQLDSAARELSGDVVFQRTLTGDDLGALVPNVDFKQGDVLPLLVWGMIVPATCTSIRYTLEDGQRKVEVGFGPDLQADTAGLAESMQQIDRQMRAEAAGIDEYLAKQLDEAKAASEQQVNGLKTYVDEQDTASRTHATTEAGNALESAKRDAATKADNALTSAKADAKTKADNALEAAKTDAKTKADKALEDAKADAKLKADKALSDAKLDATAKAGVAETNAKNYAKNQDQRTLTSANTYADKTAKAQLDEAQKALDNYREQVTGMIGEQGTITMKLDALNRDYTEKLGATGTIIKDIEGIKDNHAALSRDFTNKVGANGTLVNQIKGVADKHDQLSRDFTNKVGVNGTLTTQVKNLSDDLTNLSNDFTAKVGENGTLVKDQRNTSNLIDAMVNGKPHAQLTGSQFQQHQQSVNKMQSAFNKKQVDINTGFQGLFDAQAVTNAMQAEFNKKQVTVNKGFQDLFKAQDDINKVNSAFQKEQVDINTGFQNLFQAQADINAVNSAFQAKQVDINVGFDRLFNAQKFVNEMQQAFNKKQTGINDVYDEMWRTQAKLDLTQNYTIELNRLRAEAKTPQFAEFSIDRDTRALSVFAGNRDVIESCFQDQGVAFMEGDPGVGYIYAAGSGYTLLGILTVTTKSVGFALSGAMQVGKPENSSIAGRFRYRLQFSMSERQQEPIGIRDVRSLGFKGLLIPLSGVAPYYTEQLKSVNKEFYDKGMNVDWRPF